MEIFLSTDHFESAAKSYIKQVYGVLSIFGNFFSSIILLWLLLTIVKLAISQILPFATICIEFMVVRNT